jgi:hypothetical protein
MVQQRHVGGFLVFPVPGSRRVFNKEIQLQVTNINDLACHVTYKDDDLTREVNRFRSVEPLRED